MSARIVLMFAFAVAASCGGGDGGGGSQPPPPPTKFLYASLRAADSGSATSSGIYAFGVDAGGTLIPVSGSPFAPTSDGAPVAITRDSKFLYSFEPATGNLLAFQIQSDGSLTAVPGAPFSTPYPPPYGPAALLAHPTADFLYVSGYTSPLGGGLTVFAIDSETGALSLKSSIGGSLEFPNIAVAITPDGRFLYLDGNVSGPQILGFSPDPVTGALSAIPESPVFSSNLVVTLGPMVVDPAGKFLYVSNTYGEFALGRLLTGPLFAYSIDAVSGALTAVPGSPINLPGQQGSVGIDASGKFLVVQVTSDPPGNCVAVLSIDPDTGALTSVPGSPFGQICGVVAVDPAAPYVYIGGGYTSNSAGGVYVLSMDQTTGALTPIGSPVTYPGTTEVSSIALTH